MVTGTVPDHMTNTDSHSGFIKTSIQSTLSHFIQC